MSTAELSKTFKRSTLFERGHFPNRLSIAPVTKVTVSPEGLTVTTRPYWIFSRTQRLTWASIDSIELTRHKTSKGMGYSAAGFTQTLCHIKSKTSCFELDISGSYPDFKKPHELIQALKLFKHVSEPST